MTNINNIKALKSEKGFTIVELLIVIIVIGILATLVLVAYNNVQGQARDTKRQSSAQSVANAAEQYRTASSAGTYPDMSSGTNFTSAVNTDSNYTNGAASIKIDSSVTTKLGLSTNTATAPSSTVPDGLGVTYCPAGTTSNTAATGMKVFYWSETAKNANKFIQTGTGC